MLLPGMDFSGRVAIVTGGGTGIGKATAMLLARLGADVVVASRTAEVLEETAQTVARETGRRCIAIPTDVRDEEQVVRLVQSTVDALGRVDVLINNAGGTGMMPLSQIATRQWERSFDLNVNSAYYATREAGRHFVAQGSGAIVNISSMAGVHGVRGGAHYSASKAALQMFTRVTAAEWGKYGVRCNCVAPGMIATELAKAAVGQGQARPRQGHGFHSTAASRNAGRGGQCHRLSGQRCRRLYHRGSARCCRRPQSGRYSRRVNVPRQGLSARKIANTI